MKRMIRIVTLLMAALMLVTSCQAPDSGSRLSDETVDVSFAGPSARTITTDDGLVQTVATSDLWFQYKAVWQGEDPIPSTATNGWTSLPGPGLSSTVKLHRGTWDLSLRAFVNQSDVDNDSKFVLSGTKEGVEIGTNNMVTQTVSISLGYVRQEGDGTLHVSATYPVVYHEAANPGDSPVEAVRKVKVTANVAGTDYSGEITAFDSNNVGSLDLTVPAGAAHVTVQYYMDDSSLFEDDQSSKDVLVMATMTTNLAVSVDRDITAVTFTANQPEGTVEDNYVILHSIFDVFPDTATTTDCIVGYSIPGPFGSRSLGEIITFPYAMEIPNAQKNEKGQYLASEIGFEPIVKTAVEMINEGYEKAWIGPDAWSLMGSEEGEITVEETALKEARFTCSSTKGLDGTEIPEEGIELVEGIFIHRFVWPMFQGFVNLEKVVLPDDVECLYMGTFAGCISLKEVNLPSSLKVIGPYVFADCYSWTDRHINNNIITISSGADEPYSGPMSEVFGLTGDRPAQYLPYLKKLNELKSQKGDNYLNWEYNYTFGPNVTKLYRLVNETAKTFVVPEGIEELKETFAGCDFLESVQLPSTLKTIGNCTFSCCRSLTQLDIPEGVTSIGNRAFYNCSSLTDITIPSNVTSINSNTFYGCTSLTSITIPDGVTEIGNSAFEDCTSLTSITIPNSVTSIGSWTFGRCPNLTNIYVNQPQNNDLFRYAAVPDGCEIHWNSTGPESV